MIETVKMHERSPPLNVIVIGAGIAGLTLGISLRKQGHNVRIYEQSKFAKELGAAVHIAPNASGLIQRLGIDLAATGANEVEYIAEYSADGHINRQIPVQEANKMWQNKWMLAHRVRLHEALKHNATTIEGDGQPCEIFLSSTVVDVDAENASITLADGTVVTGDLVVGADGVHSQSRRKIPTDKPFKPFGSGKSGFRFLLDRSEALLDPATKRLCDTPGTFSIAIGCDRRIVMYPTSDNTLLNFLCIHPESESNAGDDWNTETNRKALLDVYKNFSADFQNLLSKANPESLKLWKLLDMENLPTWINSHFVLIGDAAHPFLPHQGQGAAVAIEDAVALGVVLERGLTREEIPDRLKLWESIRYKRACTIQEYTRLAGKDVQDNKLDTITHARYNFGHDEFHNSTQRLREWKWARISDPVWQMPVSFGPNLNLQKSCGSVAQQHHHKVTFTTAAISFKTSRTLIRSFLPPNITNFDFMSPGTVADCSIVQTEFNNVDWLAGGSYNLLGVYIHGVNYTHADGKKSTGTYVPVIFEDLPEAIARDREVFGLPALYSEVTAERSPEGYEIEASWKGNRWASIIIKDLKEAPLESSTNYSKALFFGAGGDEGLISWRRMPTIKRDDAKIGEKDNDGFPVWIPLNDDEPMEVEKIWQASEADVQFNALGHQKLPTLNDLVTRLAEIPVFRVLGVKIMTGLGSSSISKPSRLG